MQLPSNRELEWYDKVRKPRPSHEEHGVSDTWEKPLSERLVGGNPRNWKLQGNLLSCDTDFGPMSQSIPTDYILTGVDDDGLPILKKIGV